MLYLDANAGVPAIPAALEAYLQASRELGNPSSPHRRGQAARALLNHARRRVGAALGAPPEAVVFTSGGTEANALALRGMVRAGHRVVTTGVEHASVLDTLQRWSARWQVELEVVPPDARGQVPPQRVLEAVTERTSGVALIAASNETGVCQPVEEVARALRQKAPQVWLHTDAVQWVVRQPTAFARWGVDSLSISGHKLGAVGGVGALLVHPSRQLVPLLSGGGQEGGRRASTENVAGAVSLAVALEQRPSGAHWSRVAEQRDALEAGLGALPVETQVVGAGSPRLPNTSCVRFVGQPGDAVMMALDLEGVAVSTGSACSSGSVEPSPVLLAMGYTPAQAQEAVRFSLPVDLPDGAVESVLRTLHRVLVQLKAGG